MLGKGMGDNETMKTNLLYGRTSKQLAGIEYGPGELGWRHGGEQEETQGRK